MARNKSKKKDRVRIRNESKEEDGQREPSVFEASSDSEFSSSSCDGNDWGTTSALLDLSKEFQDSLKYDEAETRKGENKNFCIQFDLMVSVVEIPHPSHYSMKVRRRIWNSSDEIDANAERNIKEFKADGWQWRDATEESEMIWQSTGVLVHPASFNRHEGSKPTKQRGRSKQRRRRAKQ